MKINKAYSILGLIKRNFIYMDKNTCIMLYNSLVGLISEISLGKFPEIYFTLSGNFRKFVK